MTAAMANAETLTLGQAAERLGTNTAWLRQQIHAHRIAVQRQGGRIRIEPAELDRFLDLIRRGGHR